MSAEAIKKIDESIRSDDTDEIALDDIAIGSISPELKKKLESVKEVAILSMNNCKLTSLANFPELPGLIRLELMNNEFPASELKHLLKLKELQSLSLNENSVKAADELKLLKSLPLAQLDITGTELSAQADYREQVFNLFPDLQILDNRDREGEEIDYNDDEEEYDDGEEGEDDEDDENEFDDEDEEEDEDEEDDDEEDEDEEEDDDLPANKRNKK